MLRILVHLHVYYHEQIDYFIEKLKNINGVEWDLVVTYSEWNETTANKLREFKPDVKFLEVENIGYDVWPFIKLIQNTDLSRYHYVIKLHTKRPIETKKINNVKLKGNGWRDALVNGIIYSQDYFQNLLKRMDSNPSIGMVSSLETLSLNGWDVYEQHLLEEGKNLDIDIHKGYVSLGTMFMARSKIFAPLQNKILTAQYFNDHKSQSGSSYTKSHIFERLLSLLPLSYGLKHIGVTPCMKTQIRIQTGRLLKKPMEWVFCLFRKGPDHRKAIRILGIEFYIGKKIKINF